MAAERKNIFWELTSGGFSMTDPPSRLVIDEFKMKNRVYTDITNCSLQRIIKISKYHGIEITDGQIVVYGTINR